MIQEQTLVDQIREVIIRDFIPYGQMTLYKALYDAESDYLSKEELAKQIRDEDEKSFVGVLGALGNRINQTETLALENRRGTDLIIERSRVSRSDGLRRNVSAGALRRAEWRRA